MVGRDGEGPKPRKKKGSLKGGRPKFRSFPSPTPFSFFFPLSLLEVFSRNFGVDRSAATLKCARGPTYLEISFFLLSLGGLIVEFWC